MINKNDLRKAISSIAISNAKRNTIYKAFSDLDSITKEEFDSVKSDISKVVESVLTKDTVGKANGVASLDSNGSVPIEQLGNIDTTLFLIVRELPTDDIKSNKIYLVPNQDGQGNNVYIEYLYVEDVWEKVGEFKPDINYNEIINKVKEVTVCKDDNNNIVGGFDENGNKIPIEHFYSKSVDIGINNLVAGSNTICIGNNNDLDDVGESVIIGQNTLGDSFDACIAIGTDGTKVMAYDIILGGKIGYKECVTSIGYFAKEVQDSDKIIYQIGGYDGDNTHKYNLEETLDYDNDHEKYIYGIGGYNGTTTDDSKSLQEVLDDKIETVYSYGSKSYLFRIDTTDDVISVIGNTTSNTAMLFFGKDNDTKEASAVGITRTNIILRSDNNYIDVTANGIRKNDGSNTTVFATDGTLFDLDTKANTSAIPTKVSQLTNDSDFATEKYVSDNIATLKYGTITADLNSINGLFDSDINRVRTAGANSVYIGFTDNADIDTDAMRSVFIGNINSYNTNYNICIGNSINVNKDRSVLIGNNISSSNVDNILIGNNISSSHMNSVIIGSGMTADVSDGYIGIGYDIKENTNAIYQIAGYGNPNIYNLEETLTYDNQHKKYIYGIGGYDGTNSDTEEVKSLQEVLANKADASAYYTKTEIDNKGYLTAHQSLDGYVTIGNDNTPAQLFKGQGTATINAKQLLLNSPSGGVNIQPDSINIGSTSFTFKASATEGLVLMANSASKGIAFTPGKGIQSIGFDSANVNIEKGGSLVGQNKAGAVYNVNGNFVNLNPLYDLEGKFRDAIAIHVALDNITEATTAEEVVTKFNQLLKSLKAIGLMKPDTTAE